MANVKVPGVLKNKVNNQAIAQTAKIEKLDRGVIQVPPGINQGTAQLEKCGFALYKTGKNEGKPYFFASGIIQEPESVATPNGVVRVRGLYCRVQVAAFGRTSSYNGEEKTVTEKEAWQDINTQIQLLAECDPKLLAMARSVKTETDVETVTALIEQRKPYFRFSSWAGKPSKDNPNPQTQFTYHGCDGVPKGYKGPPKKGMADSTGGTTQVNGSGGTSRGSGMTIVDTESPDVEVETETPSQEFDEFQDIASLGELAQSGDVDAQERINALVEKYGLEKQAEKQKSWEDTAKLVLKHTEKGDSDEEPAGDDDEPSTDDEPEEKPMPVVGQVWKWRFMDKNTNKPTTKPMQVKILKTDINKEVADLEGMTNKKVYKNKPFAELEPVE